MAASLIVFHDPYAGMLQLYQAMISRSQYCGLYTAEAEEALMLCRTYPVSLLVTDVDTYYGDNHLINMVLQDPITAHLPILLVTVFDHWRDSEVSNGIAGVLRKPFTHTILLDSIRQSLHQPLYAQAIS